MLVGLLDTIAPERHDLYTGPGVYALKNLEEPSGYKQDTLKKRVNVAVERGELVKVQFRPLDAHGRRQRTRDGYVKREVYDKWQAGQGKEENVGTDLDHRAA